MKCNLLLQEYGPEYVHTKDHNTCSYRCTYENPLINIIREIEKCMPIILNMMSELPHWTYVLPVGRDSEPMAYVFATSKKRNKTREKFPIKPLLILAKEQRNPYSKESKSTLHPMIES